MFGGISSGGAGGISTGPTTASANGGNGGTVSGNTITLTNSSLTGAAGGSSGDSSDSGAAGHGGGSVFGGISSGGAAGYSAFSSSFTANGGNGGAVHANTIELNHVTLDGSNAAGGGSGDSFGGSGAAGHGGGSVFGGISSGGAAGYSYSNSSSLNGGHGGSVNENSITITDSILKGGVGGSAGTSVNGGTGAKGQDGGSIFGGLSQGGAGGDAQSNVIGVNPSANGGDGGSVSHNQITVAGTSSLNGSIYGGFSQGGAAGKLDDNGTLADGETGKGGLANNNTVTLVGDQLTINGLVAGGWSVNGDGSVNTDPTFTSFYQGNTLNLEGYRGAVAGIYHFENYNWVLPKDVVNQDTLIHITGTDSVALDNTKHSVALYNDGQPLTGGDQIVMIDKAQGTALLTTPRIRQGQFLVYDASLKTLNDKLVLSIDKAAITPTSKAFLEGRVATLATLNQGANMVSDYIANAPAETCRTNVFGMINGGSSRYKTGSHINVDDFSLVLGGAGCFELQNKSTVMLGAFVQHGNSNYDSYNHFDGYGDVQGWGKVRYNGAGLLFHMNVANTGTEVGNALAAANIGTKNGLYLNASVSGGHAKTSFDSNDLTDAEGVRGNYRSKSNYVNAMAGAGYAWRLDEKQMLDVYGRYSWGRLSSDNVMIGNDRLSFGSLQSSRVRLGARYHYTAESLATPYVGLAYEHEFKGNASGTAYGMSIDQPSLKGSSGIVEVGVSVKPSAANKAWTVHLGAEFYMGDRRGMSGGMKVRYMF